jgi:predicted small metal-binding protein
MPKVLYCSKINPSSKCNQVIRGSTIKEILQKAGAHAIEHGLALGPELLKKVEDAIEDE